MAGKTFDYVIVGGGTVGCVLGHQLTNAGASVVIIEAGPEQYDEMVMNPAQTLALASTQLVRNLKTTKQPYLHGREIPQLAGRILSGSSAVNYGNWTRCDSADYDEIATLVADDRWSYRRLLPYFKRTESHYDHTASRDVHGFEGPIHTTKALGRNYPLQKEIRNAFKEAGLPEISDINTGKPIGFGPFIENWRNGTRQPAGKVFDPSRATILTNTTVKKIIIDEIDLTAQGVELATGESIYASLEVVICAGSIGTPKLLMLSGIGPAQHLSSLNIPVLRDLPVGENLHDHMGATLYWKLSHPEKGQSIGHPNFNKPEWFGGNPIEWIATMPIDKVERVAQAHNIPPDDLWVQPDRVHVEMFAAYAPISAPYIFGDRASELFGTHIATSVLGLKPRSRGTIQLASKDPSAEPIIDPQYLSDTADLEAYRTGFRHMLRAMLDTTAGQSFVSEETPPPGMPKLSSDSTDEEIDARVRKIGVSFFQTSGTASMGKVVDGELRVKGVRKLRVADASIFPVPLAGHYQCPVYAMAQLAADLILGV